MVRPDWEVVLVDRSLIKISGLWFRVIRGCWHQIAKPFRRFFSTNVLIAGSASNGKTTLARDLSRSSVALGRQNMPVEYQERYIPDDELDKNDYTYLFYRPVPSDWTIDSPANISWLSPIPTRPLL